MFTVLIVMCSLKFSAILQRLSTVQALEEEEEAEAAAK